METMAERMADHLVGHHAAMPRIRKAKQALVAAGRLVHALHPSMLACPSANGSASGRISLGSPAVDER